ncbi:MAG TPA: hypothetical protein VFI39_12060 [Gemmatimonadales bacterium]|nr:hypothetical protein [Gemmatimonadales bacterium]
MEDILAIVLIFGGGTLIAISFSPIGRAIAERIRGTALTSEPNPEVLAEIDDLRGHLAELQERMDFSERMLGQAREGRAGGSGEPG